MDRVIVLFSDPQTERNRVPPQSKGGLSQAFTRIEAKGIEMKEKTLRIIEVLGRDGTSAEGLAAEGHVKTKHSGQNSTTSFSSEDLGHAFNFTAQSSFMLQFFFNLVDDHLAKTLPVKSFEQ